jgi:hypothetical protein
MESDPFEEPLEPQQPTASAGAAAYLNDMKTSTLNTVRTLVSQEKVRFVQDGFDLDLSCTRPFSMRVCACVCVCVCVRCARVVRCGVCTVPTNLTVGVV